MSTPSGPGWEPDPTGRHEYRYFDGTTWTDNVSDGGAMSTDPYETEPAAPEPEPEPEPEPQPPAPKPSAAAPAPPPVTGTAPPPPPPVIYSPTLPAGTRKGRSKGPLIAVIAVAVVAAAVVAFLVLGGDDDGGGGAGKSTVDVPKGGVATKKLSIGANQVALFTVKPQSDDVDAIIGVSIDPDSKGARDLASYYSDSTDDYTDDPGEFSDFSDRPEPILFSLNQAGPGDEEAQYLEAANAIEVTLVLGDATGEGGKLDVDIKIVDVKAPKESSDFRRELCKNDEFASFVEDHEGLGSCDVDKSDESDTDAPTDTEESS